MRCESCGMAIRGKPVREEFEGRILHFCCPDCLLEEVCRRDRALRRALPRPSRAR